MHGSCQLQARGREGAGGGGKVYLGSMQPPCVTPSMSMPNLAPLPAATHSFTHASLAAVVRVPKQDTWRACGFQPGPRMCMKLNGKGFWSPG